MIYANEKQTP